MKSFERYVAALIYFICKGLVLDFILLCGTWLNIYSRSANVEPQPVSKHIFVDIEVDGKNYRTAWK